MATVLDSYLPIFILVALSFVIIWATLAVTKFVAPVRPTPGKMATYESGEVPVGPARGPMDVQYYLFVIIFLVIDVEAAFLILAALNVVSLGAFEVGALAIFVLLLLDGWVYAWKKGALEWSS